MRPPVSALGVAPLPGHWVRVRQLDTVEDQAVVPVVVEGRQLVLVRDGDRLHATERACPHEGADLATGRCWDGKLFCPRHFAWFDLDHGQVGGGWDFRPIQIYPTQIVDGVIYVDPTRPVRHQG